MPSDLAALRGEPSYVWRSGQERRLQLILRHVPLKDATILDYGCGIGTYAIQFKRRFSQRVYGFDLEIERVTEALKELTGVCQAVGEHVPYESDGFDVVFSNEVIEHVQDDVASAREMVRITKPGGKILIYCPNRWYPFETHGHYWRGKYHFGNTPLINYLPDMLRNRLAPHVRAYTGHGLRKLFDGQPVRVVHHSRVFGGYDNLVRRFPALIKVVRGIVYALENTPLQIFGLSHFLILEKL
jgi:SAM-dependent methyltransferase